MSMHKCVNTSYNGTFFKKFLLFKGQPLVNDENAVPRKDAFPRF